MASNKEKPKMSMADYQIEKVIGEGAYGRAILCKVKAEPGQRVVIKEIAMSNLSAQERKDAWKETRVLGLLDHPNIIKYHGSFMQNNCLHIVMDFADGGDLFEQIQKAKKQHFKEDKILDWFVQICLALKHIHDRKILHRDIKCQNIFLMKNGMVKMGDFGIAKVLDHTTQFSKTAIGTPYYLSPEICQGKAYDQKSDVWSLGCVLYELCTLQHAFDSNCMNGLVMKILRSKHSPIPYFYSQNLRNLVDKLLQKDPRKRPKVNQILSLDFIRERVGTLLSETIRKIEFSHTVFHGEKGGVTPANLAQMAAAGQVPEKRSDWEDPKTAEEKPPTPPAPQPKKQSKPSMIPSRARPPPKKVENVAPPPKPAKASVPSAHVNVKPYKAKALAPRELERHASKEEILARKNAAVIAERENQRILREKRAEEERAAEEKASAKRQALEEKMKQRKEARMEQMRRLNKEAKEREQKYKNLEAPFKKAMAPVVAEKKHGKGASPEEDAPSLEPPREKKKLDIKNVTKRPGKVREREEEVRALREMMARKRAELRKAQQEAARKAKEQQDMVQIGQVQVPVAGGAAPAPAKPAPEPVKEQPKPAPAPAPAKPAPEPVKEQPKPAPAPVKEQPKPAPAPVKKPEPEPEPADDTESEPEDSESDAEQTQTPVKSVMDLINLSSDSDDDDDDDGQNDLLALAAIAKNIFDDPPSSDEDEEAQAEEEGAEEDVQGFEEPTPEEIGGGGDEKPADNKSGKFFFGGKELNLPMVTDRDSMNYRVEAIRQFIEQGLGLDKFLEAYQLITDEAGIDEKEMDERLRKVLSKPEEMSYYPLIQQLIVCEESLNDSTEL